MSDFKPRPGTFLPFMEASQRDKVSAPSGPVSPLTLLEILARQAQQSLTMFDLQTLGGLAPSRYAQALKILAECRVYYVRGRRSGASDTTDRRSVHGFQSWPHSARIFRNAGTNAGIAALKGRSTECHNLGWQARLRRREEFENLAHQAVSLIGLENELGVRRTFENHQLFWIRGLLVLGANPG